MARQSSSIVINPSTQAKEYLSHFTVESHHSLFLIGQSSRHVGITDAETSQSKSRTCERYPCPDLLSTSIHCHRMRISFRLSIEISQHSALDIQSWRTGHGQGNARVTVQCRSVDDHHSEVSSLVHPEKIQSLHISAVTHREKAFHSSSDKTRGDLQSRRFLHTDSAPLQWRSRRLVTGDH